MKFAMVFSILSFSCLAGAQPCEVYGISDSPQAFTCRFKQGKETHAISCRKGQYYLDGMPLSMAYHLDVESGSSPLVFKGKENELTVTLGKVNKAEYKSGASSVDGICL